MSNYPKADNIFEKTPFVEIRRAEFVNKGSELMLLSAKQGIEKKIPKSKFVIPPHYIFAPYEKYSKLGFYPKSSLFFLRIQWGLLGRLLPVQIRKAYGLILDNEIDIVLDAAGFAYSDQFGSKSAIELAQSAKRWRRNKTRVVMLPQAFGPFTNVATKRAVKSIVENVDLIYARESVSYKHLTDLAGERPNIKIAPDFTCLIEGFLPSDYDKSDKRVCIVPNCRMTEKTSKAEGQAYLSFMINCVKYLKDKNAYPFLLVHETNYDLKLARQIAQATGGLPLVIEQDSLKVKGIIGQSKAIIGSRYHGLVSALSQNVPALGTGWSHKYQKLFDEYGFSEGLLSVTEDFDKTRKKIDMIIEPGSSAAIKEVLVKKAQFIKTQVLKMWNEIYSIIECSERL